MKKKYCGVEGEAGGGVRVAFAYEGFFKFVKKIYLSTVIQKFNYNIKIVFYLIENSLFIFYFKSRSKLITSYWLLTFKFVQCSYRLKLSFQKRQNIYYTGLLHFDNFYCIPDSSI